MVFKQIAIVLLCFRSNFGNKEDDFLSKFFQHDYSIKDYRIDNLNYSKQFMQDMIFVYRKYNRSTKAANISMLTLVDLTKDNTSGLIQAYKRFGNEYKSFGVSFTFGLCPMFEKGIMGFGDTSCGKILCPIKKNVRQSLCNFIPDFSRMPPFIPDGQYKVKYSTTYKNEFLYEAWYYGTVYRQVKIPNNKQTEFTL